MIYCDLHMHSTASDGTVSPGDLAALARAAGLGAIALTDHDTTDGLPACAEACQRESIAFVPGIEVSADPGLDGDDRSRKGTLHILGLFVRYDDPWLAKICHRMCTARNSRNPAIVEKLRGLGVDIEYEQVLELARRLDTQVIGRPHIAQVLVERGQARDMTDAFDRYLRQGAAAYVRRDRLAAVDAIGAIHHAGGLAILAHPVQLGIRDPQQFEMFVLRLVELGLDGLETLHSDHTPNDVQRFEAIAARNKMLSSGGSDFHGLRKDVCLNGQRVPIDVYHRLRDAYTT